MTSSFNVYVSGYKPDTNLEDLIIYFQSDDSGGGDIEEANCQFDQEEAVIAFDVEEDQQRVLARTEHFLDDGQKIKVSKTSIKAKKKPTKTPRKNVKNTGDDFGQQQQQLQQQQAALPREDNIERQPTADGQDNEKRQGTTAETDGDKPQPTQAAQESVQAIIGERKIVIVTDINPETTDETLQNFFENKKRSGGGDFKELKRIKPDIAHVTFNCAEVAQNVVDRNSLELEGYLMKFKLGKPKVTFPVDKKKLYIKNIDPKTTRDSLINYVEIITKGEDVLDVARGKNEDAIITMKCELKDISQVIKKVKTKHLEGRRLHITHPEVCHSILVTGISDNTTKDALEMRFENPKHGGGEFLNDVVYDRSKGTAIMSFLDPNVVVNIMAKEHVLNGSTLKVEACYPFMVNVVLDETSSRKKIWKVDPDIMDHVSNKCEDEFEKVFGFKVSEVKYDESTEEASMLNKNIDVYKLKEYFEQFEVGKIAVPEQLQTEAILKEIVLGSDNTLAHVQFEKETQSLIVIGKKKKVKKCVKILEDKIPELQKREAITTGKISVDRNKLMFLSCMGYEKKFDGQNDIYVRFLLEESAVEIKGSKEHVNEVKMMVLMEANNLQDDSIEVNKRKELYLTSEGVDTVNESLQKAGKKAMVIVGTGKPTQLVKVVYFNSEKLGEIKRVIADNLFEDCCELDEASALIVETEGWDEMKRRLSKDFDVVLVVEDNDGGLKVWLVGEKSKVQKAQQQLKEFADLNTVISNEIRFDEGVSKFLSKHCKAKLENIAKSHEAQLVKIEVNEDGTLTLQGTKEGAREAERKLKSMVDKFEHCTIPIDQPGMKKYFQNETGKSLLNGIEYELCCAITVANTKEKTPMSSSRVSLTADTGAQSSQARSQLVCSYETPEKIIFKVYQDDITEHQCEVIVNAANGKLDHIGGLAGAIVRKGGVEIQKDCTAHVQTLGRFLLPGQIYVGIPGTLPCKKLIHMVGPMWTTRDKEKHKSHLKYGCEKTLEAAKQYKTIALPAVGSGIYGVPKDVCARIMIESAVQFSATQGSKQNSLEEIHFVNIDKATVDEFRKQFDQKFKSKVKLRPSPQSRIRVVRKMKKAATQRSQEDEPRLAKEFERLPSGPAGNVDSITTATQRLSVVIGDLATHQADILVNTTGKNLDLTSNPCGLALSKQAGPALQAECSQVGTLKVGQVAVTSGANLSCKAVCHVHCTQYGNGQGEQVLRVIIRSCLKEATTRSYSSIAFPAIGTGVLGFPHSVTAKICFEEVKTFGQKNPRSSLNDVRFVVFHLDQAAIKAFQDEIRQQPEWDNAGSRGNVGASRGNDGASRGNDGESRRNDGASRGNDGASRREMRVAVDDEPRERAPLTISTTEDGDFCVPVKDGGKLYVLRGDITKATTDVIAHLSNCDGSMNGGVAKALLKVGGAKIAVEREKGVIPLYETVLTKAGKLQAKYVAHMAGPQDVDFSDIKKCLRNCFDEVKAKQCTSISLPAVGTGVLGMKPEKSAEAMLSAIVEFLQANPGCLTTVRIIIYDKDIFPKFSKAVKKLISGSQEQEPGIIRSVLNSIASFFGAGSSSVARETENYSNPVTFFLKVCSEKRETLKKVEEKISTMMNEQKKNDLVEDDEIEHLTSTQENKLQEIGRKNRVEVIVEKPVKRIVVSGHQDDVSLVLLQIRDVLHSAQNAKHEQEKAELLAQSVKWYWVDDTGNDEEYDKTTNSRIEKAHNKNEKSVMFTLKEGRCAIDFGKMEETNLDKNKKTKVKRVDQSEIASITVPDYWDAQPKDVNGKELPVYNVPLDPTNHQSEYKKVSDGFRQTFPSQILKIERIQNPGLYKLYAMKKKSMDERHGSNEKILYHGTSPQKVPDINRDGLNRNYKGVNGTLHGHGIYFARDAKLSSRYAPADAAGQRTMYVARVAVGRYAQSNQNMIVPPFIPASQNERYDSVVDDTTNPTIYVMFYDNEYYPEYLITYR